MNGKHADGGRPLAGVISFMLDSTCCYGCYFIMKMGAISWMKHFLTLTLITSPDVLRVVTAGNTVWCDHHYNLFRCGHIVTITKKKLVALDYFQ